MLYESLGIYNQQLSIFPYTMGLRQQVDNHPSIQLVLDRCIVPLCHIDINTW